MKILKENPPNLEEILDSGMRPHQFVVYTYGDTLYNPSGVDIPDHLMCHEETHTVQQGADPEAWWKRYMFDPLFRVAQEAEAYARQYDFICHSVRDRNQRNRILIDLSRSLASPIYGHVLTPSASYTLIKGKIKTK